MNPMPCNALLHRRTRLFPLIAILCFLAQAPAIGSPFTFSTGDPNGLIATGARPSGGGKTEIESADDFILSDQTHITHATFTGLLTGGAAVSDLSQVMVDIYRVFPSDSDVGRTSGAPTFSTPQVPTRVNSPSDVALSSRDSALGTLSFSTTILNASFTANNSVLDGINPLPNTTTGGDGPATGMEVLFDVMFTTPFDLPADHYFFVPLVGLNKGDFLWLSAPRPIVAPGTPFPPGATDLQTWIRDANLDPDWLRVGTDIIGSGTYNAAFSLDGQTVPGQTVPEPATLELLGIGALALIGMNRRSTPVTL